MAARLAPLLAEIDRACLLVTHRGVMRCLLALASGWAYRGPEPFRIKRAAVHPVTLRGGRPAGFGPPERLEAA
jgi:probable phosphoglycerate mutase